MKNNVGQINTTTIPATSNLVDYIFKMFPENYS